MVGNLLVEVCVGKPVIWDCERANRYFIKSRKRSIFVTDSYLNDNTFKGMQRSKQGMWKGVPFVNRRYTKGLPFIIIIIIIIIIKNGIY